MAKPHPRRGPHAAAVGAAMRLHLDHHRDALRIDRLGSRGVKQPRNAAHQRRPIVLSTSRSRGPSARAKRAIAARGSVPGRSEEHTSELQSLMRISYAVFCLKKKTLQNLTQK